MSQIKEKAIELRMQGMTYTEIRNKLRANVPKSTLSEWCRKLTLSSESRAVLGKKVADHLVSSRIIAHAVLKKRRGQYLSALDKKNSKLILALDSQQTAKLVLHALFLGEGFKKASSKLAFGNSDPFIIRLYLKLLRLTYEVKESSLHLTVQCRADQNIKALEKFWCNVTNIPPNQVYKAQIDSRTIGKQARNSKYKGVCKIDYLVADVYNDMNSVTRVIEKQYLGL